MMIKIEGENSRTIDEWSTKQNIQYGMSFSVKHIVHD